jgi:hypothetical protein
MNPGGLPTDVLALPYMPSQLVGMMTPEHFMFTSGLTGMFCGFMVWIIFSRGL